LPEAGGARLMQIISIEQLYDGHATQTGLVAAGTYTGALAGRYTIIVDDSIDPYDLDDVL
jgi:UbiD family decarboxylase